MNIYDQDSKYPITGLNGKGLHIYNNDISRPLIIKVRKPGGGGIWSQYKIKPGETINKDPFYFKKIKIIRSSLSFSIFVEEV